MKKLFCAAVALILCFTCMPFSAAAREMPVRAAVLSDLHLVPAELTGQYCKAFLDYYAEDTRQHPQSEALLESALAAVAEHARRDGIRYLFIAGDMSKDGEYRAHEILARRLERFENETGVHVLVINGNHDINNSSASTFEKGFYEKARKTSPEEWLSLYRNLGYDLACSVFTPPEGEKAGMLSYSVRLEGGYRLIAFDAEKYSADSTSDGADEREGYGNISGALMEWILSECAAARAAGEEIIGLTHHNVASHFDIEAPVMPKLILDNWLVQSEMLADAGMHLVFSGHVHQNDIVTAYSDSGEPVTDVSTASLTGFPNSFREVLFDRAGGRLTADIKTLDVDCEQPVVFMGKPYPQPYQYSYSFGQSFGRQGLGVLGASIAGAAVDGFLGAGEGILGLLASAGVEPESLAGDLAVRLGFAGTNPEFAESLVSLIRKTAAEIDKTYLRFPGQLKKIVEDTVIAAARMQVSDIPCVRFLDTLGFGNPGRGGNFEEFGASLVAYMFGGNEDLGGDPFSADCVKRMENGEILGKLIGKIACSVAAQLLEDGFDPGVGKQAFEDLVAFLLGASLGEKSSFAALSDFLWESGAVRQAADCVVLSAMAAAVFKGSGLSGEIGVWLRSLLTDTSPGLCRDSFAFIDCQPVREVPATAENYRIPFRVECGGLPGSLNAMQVTWLTKYSVLAGDIEIIPSGGACFGGSSAAPAGVRVAVQNESTVASFNALEAAGLSFFPYRLPVVRHRADISGLLPGRTYLCRVGDARRGWWSEPFEVRTTLAGFAGIGCRTIAQVRSLYSIFAAMLKIIFEAVARF
ncbi:MAG TPA: metallophosphoesterase [Clostridiales bacterium]|nr:MAG: Calcineurin-like phosphoesterase superfamily domain protein [Firmicutes bacterium ADurb.Bin262]HQK72620.1 metallophosphoesterase [Clostridiales bacterium]